MRTTQVEVEKGKCKMAKMDRKQTVGILSGFFAFCKIAEPGKKYQSNDTEYSITVIVREDEADAWEEKFKKQPPKKIRAAEFEEKYKFANPYPGEKSVYAITLKRAATKDGVEQNPQFRPRIYIDQEDGTRIDCTTSRLCANGTFGKVSYYISVSDFGTTARLQNVLIKEEDFIEYTSGAKGGGDEFGSAKKVIVEAAKDEVVNARANREASDEKPEKPAKKQEPVFDDFDDESSPF